MDGLCESINKNNKELAMIMEADSEWNDGQFEAFRNNIAAINDGLTKVLKYESEYVNTFIDRVNELRS